MKRNIVLICVVLLTSIPATGKPHEHEHEALQANYGTASNLDVWRHFLLHTATLGSAFIGPYSADSSLVVSTAKQFKTEFMDSISAFNATQETLSTTDQLTAMDSFLIQRDNRVQYYVNLLNAKLSPLGHEELWAKIKEYQPKIQSTRPLRDTKVASLSPMVPSGQTGYQCNNPFITCSLTYSTALGIDSASGGTISAEMDILLDGSETMNYHGNPIHTPQTDLTIGSTRSTQYGSGVCGNCYLYASGDFPISWTPGQTLTVSDFGAVVCSIVGTFLQTASDTWLVEDAYTRVQTQDVNCNQGEKTLTGSPYEWWYPNPPKGSYKPAPTLCYYSVVNWCTTSVDADFSSFKEVIPEVYLTGGTLNGASVPSQGQYSDTYTLLVRLCTTCGFKTNNSWLQGLWYKDNNLPNGQWNNPADEVDYLPYKAGGWVQPFYCTNNAPGYGVKVINNNKTVQ